MKVRKSIYALTQQERNDFIRAVQALKNDGTWDEFAKIHSEAMFHFTLLPGETLGTTTRRNAAHRGPAFLPWHRIFILKLEEALEQKVPGVTLPYWPWEEDSAGDPATARLWRADFIGGSGSPIPDGPFSGWRTVEVRQRDSQDLPVRGTNGNIEFREGAAGDQLERNLGAAGVFPTVAQVEDLFTNSAFRTYDRDPWSEASTNSFRNRLEGFGAGGSFLHNVIHVWVGGDMEDSTSPNDPVFFLHHCNVDRLWAIWQSCTPTPNYLPVSGGPTGHNLNDSMFPWDSGPASDQFTPARALDIRALGYTYATHRQVTLRRTTGDRFVAIPEIEVVDFCDRRKPTATTIFMPVVPGGKLRAQRIDASGEVLSDPAASDEVNVVSP